MARLSADDRHDLVDELLRKYRVTLMGLKAVRWQLEETVQKCTRPE